MAEVRHLRLGGPEAPGAARDFVCSVADEAYADTDLNDSLRLLVSEVVTNSIRHGTSGTAGCVEVILYAGPERLRLEIVDDGPGFLPDPTPGPVDEPGGWGLFLVDNLADDWGVDAADGTRVWLEMSPAAVAA
jgi:anti-sigma regulatory factor (Ser/Thr protein kinase)